MKESASKEVYQGSFHFVKGASEEGPSGVGISKDTNGSEAPLSLSAALKTSYPCSPVVQTLRKNWRENFYSPVHVMALRCRCGSSWCPVCSKRGAMKRIAGRLRFFNWKRVRHIMLSVDAKLFKSAEECVVTLDKKRAIAQFIHNLSRRKGGKRVLDWMWVREWHKNGFPHFHLFVEVLDEGKDGMIGADLIRELWQWGEWVYEDFISSEDHWKNLCGYFDRHGYFRNSKGVQGVLPAWALASKRKIKRYGSRCCLGPDGEVREVALKRGFSGLGVVREKRCYGVILEGCGKSTMVRIESKDVKVMRKVKVPINKIIERVRGFWLERAGYFFGLDERELWELGEIIPELAEVIDEVLGADRQYCGERVFDGDLEIDVGPGGDSLLSWK